ncbi:hypothetical protein MMC07_006207 [Pseudocyphellaria aurata]|nr:hypothetical protein [Pseudocyphellaria aurata]
MKAIFARAALFSAFLAPLSVHARRQRSGEAVTFTNADHNVIVTSTAPPVYVTVTRSAGTNDETTVVEPSPTSTAIPPPSSTITPAPGQTPSATEDSIASEVSSSSLATVLNHSWSSGQGPLATSAPSPTQPANVSSAGPGRFTIAITNSYGSPVSLAFGSNIPGPPQDGAATPTVLVSTTSYTYPTGWAGRIGVGKTVNGYNSLIEASFPGEQWNSLDVSYVDGYSVPITCSNQGTVIAGCNIELFDHGTCQHPVDNGAACDNNAGDDGPAEAFFKPCEKAAYTFPHDDVATWGSITGQEISCCIGHSCPAPSRQASRKRDSIPLQRHSHHHHARHQDHRRSMRSHVHQLVQEAKLRK